MQALARYKHSLTRGVWNTLRDITVCFKPFEKFTVVTRSDFDLIEKTLVTTHILVKHLEKQKNKYANNARFENTVLMA